MSSRYRLLCLTFLCLWSGVLVAERPNVLFITVDDMNRDSVGVFGCPIPDITPNIDRLASEGMKFEHAHVSIAICQPTRAVWMTGRYPHRSGALGFNPINKSVPTLLETLHDAGYYTGIIAKVGHVVPTRGKAWDYVVQANELKNGRDPQLYYERAGQFFETAAKEQRSFFMMANSQDPHRLEIGERVIHFLGTYRSRVRRR
jgi:N-sulfoglucosamine sulfohydrolase